MKDYEEKVLNIMDSTKVNIIAQLNRAYQQGYEDGRNNTEYMVSSAYKHGMEESWEAAKWLYNNPVNLAEDIFNCDNWEIYSKCTVQEVVHKIKEYEDKEQQKQDAEQVQDIQVGDEVVIDDSIGIVTRAFPGAVTCYVMRKDGSSGEEDRNDCKTTGRHFDQIAEVLAEMRGESE